ncbi:MAG: flagellar hook-basal body protein [Ignavibacteriales bacterium]|nr:flagellar hook-basal body protein [Ignavibacteriales bacterium]
MIKGIYTAGRSLDQRIKNIDVIANNLANINTTGYKREIPFSEIIDQYDNVKIRKLTSQQQGEILQTSNPLDLAISGDGFFAVKNPEGNIEFTRDGRFKINDEGFFVDGLGRKVMGKNGEISVEETLLAKETAIRVGKGGEIKVGEKVIDTILVLNVNDASGLIRTSGSNFSAEGQEYTPADEGSYSISQGYLEEANTNPIIEMEAMIQLNKEYEAAQKIISALDSSLGQAIEIGKI